MDLIVTDWNQEDQMIDERIMDRQPLNNLIQPFINFRIVIFFIATFFLSFLILGVPLASAGNDDGEQIYKRLSSAANSGASSRLLSDLKTTSKGLNWSTAQTLSFVGNLRILGDKKMISDHSVFLIRSLKGEVYYLSIPDDSTQMEAGAKSVYADLVNSSKNKMRFSLNTLKAQVEGNTYFFAKLDQKPEQLLLDKIFKICIILMLFFVMVGMGLTLTFKDFAIVFKNPRGILIGQVLQFGAMPFLAMCLGRFFGFHEAYPFIFVGMILITAIPGGVTSNLMTYYAKGDLALSISLTSFSTVLSIVFTPLLLALYCSNMPEVSIPVTVVIQTIMILVLIPLAIGMLINKLWPLLAKKVTPFFSALGIIALLVLIIAGILSNLNIFTDTARYGVKFYATIFSITMLGMVFGILFSKIFRIDNYQARAISLETGLRNSALAMTLAILIQDSMGDFYSSMFVTSGLFGLIMYLAGVVAIFGYKYILPIEESDGSIE